MEDAFTYRWEHLITSSSLQKGINILKNDSNFKISNLNECGLRCFPKFPSQDVTL